MSWYSRTWTWLDGKWQEGNPPMMGPRTHAAWLGSSVFDGARALADAQARGFGNAIVLDMLGNVAETATSNLFIVRDGVVVTPAPNGTFLNGITRQRTIALLRQEGRTVLEQRMTMDDVLAADEVFCTGNYGKVQPCTRVEDRKCAIGPVYRKARELYWAFAHDKR